MKFTFGLIGFFIFCFVMGIGTIQYKDDIYKAVTHKKNRILVCMTSWKRPIFLSGQLLRFKNQTYKNFHISVSVKGVPEKWANATFMKEWQPLIDSGLVSLRFDKNGPQLKNFLDTVRDVDLQQYDYFCKVDDDDWYTPDYLESVNDFLNQEKDIMISRSTNTVILENREEKKDAIMYANKNRLTGPTMCLSRPVIEMLLKLEKNPGTLEPDFSRYLISSMQYAHEDRMFDEVAQKLGKAQYRNGGDPKVIYGWQYPSVIRKHLTLP